MELFMKVWRETKPELFTVTHLKALLSAEVNYRILSAHLTDK